MTDNTAGSGSNGAGQQHPNDSASEANAIAFAVKRILAKYDTMLPVKVIAVHAGSGTPPGPATVDVQPLVSRVDGNMNGVQEGTVSGIICSRIQGGPWVIVCDPAVGDIGWVVAADRDISKIKAGNGAAGLPGSSRRWSIADGVYAGAILNKAPKAFFWLKSDGSLQVQDSGGYKIQTDGQGNATFTGNMTVVGNLTTSGNLQLGGSVLSQNGSVYGGNFVTSGNVTASGIGLKEHVHTYTAPSSGGSPGQLTGGPQG
ncbi:hypothetical protein H8A95_16035 [Bradyrhizobium sp. Pear76]|uniref:hypothetical protein n=1 Tax=Bradyrhizobium oropedii TaxID=1571201 RepID=UPI001E623A8C|nr:hypothetical protein [Bradyrhizobium oropedii]MCC8963781.1 hypothetical protein [Bradyrhizobium oropedii]